MSKKQKTGLTLQEMIGRFLLVGVILILIIISYFVLIYPTAKMALSSRWMPMHWNDGDEAVTVQSDSSIAYPGMMGGVIAPSIGVSEIGIERIGMMPPFPGGDAYLYNKDQNIDQKVIKTANLDIQVDNVVEKIAKIQLLAETHNGFVQNSNISENTRGAKFGYITIRVVESQYQAALSDIRALSLKINSESANGQDVTQQYVDLQTNLTHLKAVEAQYLDLLTKAKTVDEILKVQEQLNNTQGQIQSIEGQIKYMSNQTSYATISISLTEQAKITLPAEKFDIGQTIRNGVTTFIKVLQNFFAVIVVVFFVILGLIPYLLFFWLLYWLGRKLYFAITKK